MASLLSWLGNTAKGVERQVNPFDNGATYSNPVPIHPHGTPPSLIHQANQSFVQPLERAPINLANTVYNRAVAPTFNLPHLTPVQTTPISGLSRSLNATGSLHQTLGDTAQLALTLGSGGLANLAERGGAGLAGFVAPKLATRAAVLTSKGLAARALPGALNTAIKANAGGLVAGGFNAASAAGAGAKPGQVLKSGAIGYGAGVGLPLAAKAVGVAAKPALKATGTAIDNRTPLNAVGAIGKNVSGVGGESDPVIKAIANENKFKDQIQAMRKQAPNDNHFYENTILNNVEKPGDVGNFARHVARRVEGGGENPTNVLNDALQKTDLKAEAAAQQSAHVQELKSMVSNLEKSTGQKGLYSSVLKNMAGMNEKQQLDYLGKSLTSMRDNGVLAMDHLNKEGGFTPPKSGTIKPSISARNSPTNTRPSLSQELTSSQPLNSSTLSLPALPLRNSPPTPVSAVGKNVPTTKSARLQQFAQDYLTKNKPQATTDYQTRTMQNFGTTKPNIVSADEAKYVVPNFSPDKSGPYHEGASAFAKDYYKQLLADQATKDKSVLITGGGMGAGKTTGLALLRREGMPLENFAAVNDTNLTNFKSATDRIEPALASGRRVTVQYTYRDPVDAFVNGNIPRAAKQGRVGPIVTHADTHVGSLDTIQRVAQKYKNNPNVDIQIIDNTRGRGNQTVVPLDFLKDKGYNKTELIGRLHDELQQAHNQGHVSPEAYKAYQEGLGVQSNEPQNSRGNLSQPQPQRTGRPNNGLTAQDANKLSKQLTSTPTPPKINTPTIGTKPLGLVKTVATSPQTTAGLSRDIQGSYNPLANKVAMRAAQQRIAADPNAAYQFAANTHSAEGNATAIQLAKQLEAEGKHDQAANLIVAKSKQALQAGQGNQIYSLWDKLSPETVAQTAAKTIEKYNQTARSPIPQLTAEQYKGFVEQAKNIQSLPEGSRARGVATQNLMKQIGQLVPSSKADKAFSLYRTGLLTGFRTPGKVVVSHAVSSGFEQAKNLPAKVADTAIGLARAPFIGKYQRGLSVTPRGNVAGSIKGTFAAVDNLVHGYDAPGSGGIAKDFANSTHFNTKTLPGKVAQAYVDTIGHLHGSLYKPFYGAQHLNSLYDMAITNAKNQGLKGPQRDSFVQQFVKDATDAAVKDHTQDAHAAFTTPEGAAQRANAEAAYTTFQNKTLLSEAAAGVKGKTPGARYIVPFSQIPSSIASKVVDYSPAGAIKEAIVQAKNGTFDQRALSQAIGRSTTGTGLTALGYHLYNSGNITTAYPTDKKEQAQWKLEGKQANSILVGGKWRQLASLGPAGDTLAVGANVAEGMKGNKKTPGSLTNAAIQGAVGGVNVLGNSPYLQGIQNVGAAISEPGTKSQKVAEGLAGGLVPTAIANIASATDPLQRQTNSPVDSVTNKIPGLRQKNLPQVDVLGRNIARQQGPLGTLTDPFYSTTAKTDPVTSELNRLNGTYNPATPTQLTKNQSMHGAKVSLNPQELTALQQQSGQPLNQALSQLIKSGTYAQASDQNKANTISSVTTAVRDAIKNGQPADLNSILDKAQQTLTKGIFKDSGQASQTIGNTVYKRGANGQVTTSKVKVPKATRARTPRVRTTRATGTRTARTSTARAAKAVKVPSFKITGAKAFRPPKGVKIKVAKASFKTPKTQRIAVSKIPNVNKKKLG